jgi:hypothetical protein
MSTGAPATRTTRGAWPAARPGARARPSARAGRRSAWGRTSRGRSACPLLQRRVRPQVFGVAGPQYRPLPARRGRGGGLWGQSRRRRTFRVPSWTPGFDVTFVFRHVISGSLSLAFLAHTCRAQRRDFPATLTTTALNRSSSRWFAASACTAAAEGHQANNARLLHLLHSTASSDLGLLHPASFNVRGTPLDDQRAWLPAVGSLSLCATAEATAARAEGCGASSDSAVSGGSGGASFRGRRRTPVGDARSFHGEGRRECGAPRRSSD